MAAAALPLATAYDNAPVGTPRDALANVMVNFLYRGAPFTPMPQINHICIRLIAHGDKTAPGILLNNIINALKATSNPGGIIRMPWGNVHTAITAFLVRQLQVMVIPSPARENIFWGILQELRLTRRAPGQVVFDIAAVPAYNMALQSIIQEASPGMPNPQNLRDALIIFLRRYLHARMDRPGATWDNIANVLSLEANVQPWVYTNRQVIIVRALIHYSDLMYTSNRHTPNNIIMCLIQQAGQYPVDTNRREITDALLRAARLPHCPLGNDIMRALMLLVRTVPPTNIVDHKEMNRLRSNEKILLNEFLRLQGITVPPPNFPPGLPGVPGGLGGHWTLCHSLGSGGEGIAYLYAYIDDRRTIRDRVVQRNVISDHRHWNKAERWYNGIIGGIPNEGWLMRFFNNSPNVVGYRSHSVNVNNWIYTTYIDYAEHGSLEQLITSHRNNPVKSFDESFLWHLFRSLARGVRDMHAALPLQATEMRVQNVVHADLHCGNVFLGQEDNIVFRLYPTPKIADFGSAQVTDQFDPDNPRKFLGGFHKDRFDPPELMRTHAGWTHNTGNRKALQSANVYQIGVIMLCAMRLQINPSPAITNPPDVDNVPPGWLVRGHSTAGYSQGLKDLVHACLRWNEAARVDPPTLLANIAFRGAAYFGPGTLETWRAAPARKPTTHRHKLRVSMTDTYRVGLKLAGNPRRPQRVLRGGRR